MEKEKSKISFKKLAVGLLQKREISLLLLIILLVIFLTTQTDKFLTIANLRVLMNSASTDMIVVVPMAISLIAGNSDFSPGSALCFSAMMAGLAMNAGGSPLVGVLVGLGVGAVLGFLNAVSVNRLKVTPLVATLGTWYAYRALAQVIAGTQSITSFDQKFLNIGRATIGGPQGLQMPVVYTILIVIIGVLALKYSNFFHNAYYIGSNKNSAKLAGINAAKFTYISYTLTGMVAGFAGIVLTARIGSVSIAAGDSLEFRNIVAMLIGGISMDGGEGSIIGAALGVIFMQIVQNALVLLYIDTAYTNVIIGVILILAVALDQFIKRQRASVNA